MIGRLWGTLRDWLASHDWTDGAVLRRATFVALASLFAFLVLLGLAGAGAPFAKTELVRVEETVERTVPVEVTVEKTVEVDADRARQICRDRHSKEDREYNDRLLEWLREGNDARDFPEERPDKLRDRMECIH